MSINWGIDREKIILGLVAIILIQGIFFSWFVVANNRTVMECGKAQIVTTECRDCAVCEVPDVICGINVVNINETRIDNRTEKEENGKN